MIIIPYTTYYSNSQSLTQTCLEKPELSDVYKKYLINEQLTEDDFNKIEECINLTKQFNNVAALLCITIVTILLIAVIIYIIKS